MKSGVFRITMENIEKHTDIRLLTTEKKNQLFSVETKLSHSKLVFRKPITN